jgi:hypothetical protein
MVGVASILLRGWLGKAGKVGWNRDLEIATCMANCPKTMPQLQSRFLNRSSFLGISQIMVRKGSVLWRDELRAGRIG